MKYRPEIDGLRAVAVMSVIFFHAGFVGFSGGYIGVDIFFIISGFLITTIILEEKGKGSFSLVSFYERRARRILPALSVVLLFTSVAAYILMPAPLLKEYSWSLASTATFSSNIYFYLTSGYFSTVADEKPLLHTWSLAVEEQYYLFFPVVITIFWYLGRKKLGALIAIIATLSILGSHLLITKGYDDANFYLIFSRAWELLFGSLIPFLPFKKWTLHRWQREMSTILGLILIIISIIYFDNDIPFPSYYTLIPVLGTCLIIVFANGTTLVGRLLGNGLFVSLGLISYSLYLWHQPLFAFLRIKSVGEPQPYLFVFAIVFTLVFSLFSWRYVEKPFRNRKVYSRPSIFRYASASILAFIFIGIIGVYYNGFGQRFDMQAYMSEDAITVSPNRNKCHTKGIYYLKPSQACNYFGDNVTWASFGDSHSVELAYALAKKIKYKDEGVLHLSFSGCPPALLFESERPGCTEWTREALHYLINNEDVEHVLLTYRHSYYLYGSQLDTFPNIPEGNTFRISQGSKNTYSPNELRENYWKSFSEIIKRLLHSGKKVYVLYPIPELPVHIQKAITQFSVFSSDTMIDIEHATNESYYKKRNEFIINKLDSLHYGNNLHAIKPFEIMCHDQSCPAINDGSLLYFDDNHLSVFGAEYLIDKTFGSKLASEYPKLIYRFQ